MRLQLIVLVLGLCAFESGCCGCGCYFQYAVRNLIDAPIECLDECAARHRNRQWAKAAWNRIAHSDPAQSFSEDYEDGFLAGFADFLDNGGDRGLVPVAPPHRYRRVSELSPAQYQAAEDWFAGFRHGVAVAQGSGLRLWNVVPTSGEGLPAYSPRPRPVHPVDGVPAEPMHPLPFPAPAPAPEQLPVSPTPAKSLQPERTGSRTTRASAAPEAEPARADGGERDYAEPLKSPYHILLRPPHPGWELVCIPSGD
jgi:hypothetical protein